MRKLRAIAPPALPPLARRGILDSVSESDKATASSSSAPPSVPPAPAGPAAVTANARPWSTTPAPPGPVPSPIPVRRPTPVPTGPNDAEAAQQLAEIRRRLFQEIGKRIVGQEDVIDHLLISLFSRGHCLFVGVPGLAKTLLIQTLAEVLDLSFGRIQFTPDLMPSDITGSDVLEEDRTTGRRVFRFIKGPLFAHVILADEINRTPPKTQAALLQAMQERRVSAGGTTYDLPEPFLVFATQNPIEQEGTYPLPEAQLDRFMFNIKVEYPSLDEEKRILSMIAKNEPVELTKVLSAKAIINLQKLVRSVPIGDFVIDFAARLARATRPRDPSAPEIVKKLINWGAGPRAGIYLIQAGQAFAAMDGRFSVAIDDIKKAAIPVLRHRISTNFQAQADGKTTEDVIEELLKVVSEPEPAKYAAARKKG